MKKRLPVLMVSALFALAACGGGGGGGGGVNSTPPLAWEPPSDPYGQSSGSANTVATFVLGADIVPVETRNGVPLTVTKTANGLTLSAYNGARTVTLSADAGDFKNTSGDYITAVKESSGKYSDYSSISYRAQDTVALGGKKLGLSHSDFGIWTSYVHEVADGQDPEYGPTSKTVAAFYMGDPGKTANFSSSSGQQTFSGNTAATAHGGAVSGTTHLTGTARMSFTAATSINTNLRLTFPGFYNFQIPVEIDANGKITQGAGTAFAIDNGDLSGRNMNGVGYYKVDGQFYGPSGSNPKEAVGGYLIQSADKEQYTSVNGSFGLKK